MKRACQAQGTGSAKALRLDHAWLLEEEADLAGVKRAQGKVVTGDQIMRTSWASIPRDMEEAWAGYL